MVDDSFEYGGGDWEFDWFSVWHCGLFQLFVGCGKIFRLTTLANALAHVSPWRNWLARSTVTVAHREVGSSSLPGDDLFARRFQSDIAP